MNSQSAIHGTLHGVCPSWCRISEVCSRPSGFIRAVDFGAAVPTGQYYRHGRPLQFVACKWSVNSCLMTDASALWTTCCGRLFHTYTNLKLNDLLQASEEQRGTTSHNSCPLVPTLGARENILY